MTKHSHQSKNLKSWNIKAFRCHIFAAIPEEQNQKDSLNGNHDSNANIDDTNVASSIGPQSAEHDASSPAANAGK